MVTEAKSDTIPAIGEVVRNDGSLHRIECGITDFKNCPMYKTNWGFRQLRLRGYCKLVVYPPEGEQMTVRDLQTREAFEGLVRTVFCGAGITAGDEKTPAGEETAGQ